MLREGKKLKIASKVADAILAASAAATMAQGPKQFVTFGAVQSPGVVREIERGIKRSKADQNLDSGRVSHPARNKTFKEFVEEAYLIEKTFSTRQAAVDYHKENPPYGDEPYQIRRKNRSGEPEAWRPVRANKRNQQSSTRSKNKNPLKYSEVLDWVKRNLIPNPEKTAKEMMRRESSRKASQTRRAKSKTERTGVLHTVDHPQPVSQDRRNPELRPRFQRVVPGDTSSNREVMTSRQNASKNSKPPKRGEPGWGKTRSGSIQSLSQ